MELRRTVATYKCGAHKNFDEDLIAWKPFEVLVCLRYRDPV